MSRFLPGLLFLLVATPAFAQAPWPINQVMPGPFGMQLKEQNIKDANLVADMGAKIIRRGFLWQSVEKEAGVYEWPKYDLLVEDCKKRGITLIVALGLQNTKLYGHPKDEPGRTAYVNYCVATVNHFKGAPIIWEIWNEPNTKTFWGGHGKTGNSDPYATEYVNLVKAAVPAMKKADPKCIILGGSMSNVWSESFKWMTYCTQKGVMDTGIDAWSLHPYGVRNPEDYISAYTICRDIMKKNGSGKMLPFVNSERGFPLGKSKEGANTSDDAKQALEYQAWHLVRQFLIDQLCDIKATVWYEWSGGESFSVYDPKGPTFYPSYHAGKVLISTLTGSKFDSRVTTDNDRDFVLKYKDAKGGTKLVAWAGPPVKGGVADIGSHPAAIPVQTQAAQVKVLDIYGKESQVPVTNGTVTLTLSGAPQYILP